MIGELLRVGDKVVLEGAPDEPVAEVIGFGTTYYGRTSSFGRKPGKHYSRYKVLLRSGESRADWSANSSRLTLADQAEGKRRREEWFAKDRYTWDRNQDFISDLPELPFYEFDKVSCIREIWETDELYVISIDYNYMDQTYSNGLPYPIYNISPSLSGGTYTTVTEDELTLISRGNIWKHFHGEPTEFADLNEEARFHDALCWYDEIRNPATNLYAWTLAEAVDAIRAGLADGFTVGGVFGVKRHAVQRFRDREFGERVRQQVLSEFTPEAVEELTRS